ncbi:hypothetical protein HYG81_05065 [Natrinema zhouii]|nr:hypothetical protein [Natrinema zhouii]QLK26982.2 hypothetical protein HYG81_05065 [Natrinema zhouii]
MTAATNQSANASDAGDSESPTEETADLSLDDAFHILQTFRRRETIRYVLQADDCVKMRDVAEHVAAKEHETTVEQLLSDERQRVYIPLYQSHLPKLDEAGIIDYDKPRGIVRPGERLEQFRQYLDSVPSETDDAMEEAKEEEDATGTSVNDQQYAAIGVSLSLLLASVVGILQLPGLILGVIITALFVLETAAF